MEYLVLQWFLKELGHVWWASFKAYFYILNNFTHILTRFFTHTYIKNIQIILLKLHY